MLLKISSMKLQPQKAKNIIHPQVDAGQLAKEHLKNLWQIIESGLVRMVILGRE